MNRHLMQNLIDSGRLRARFTDIERIRSLVKAAETNLIVVKDIKLNENSATLVFREIYESIRQLGDAKWWLLGYEPLDHDISLDILKEIDITNRTKMNFLQRFKRIRHDANYRGFMVSVSQAEELIDFWSTCGQEILDKLKKEISKGIKTG